MFEGWLAEEIMGFFVAYAFLAALAAWFAQSRGRDAVNWFGWALFISPVVAFIVLVLIGPKKAT